MMRRTLIRVACIAADVELAASRLRQPCTTAGRRGLAEAAQDFSKYDPEGKKGVRFIVHFV
jgi:hypothetical protein